MEAGKFFSETYSEACSRFLEAAEAAGAEIQSHENPFAVGPDGGALHLDTAWFGPRDAGTVLLNTCGTHGAEGFAGSAAQLAWMSTCGPLDLPRGVAALFVHAVNPYGFAWGLRGTENNVDLNRNFGFAFSSSTSFNPCSEMYAGVSAFSSAEARALGTYLQDPLNNIRGFFDLHSYGQLLMYPFSYSCEEAVADEEDLLEVSLGAISALKRSHGRQFNTGKICQVYAKGGGNAVDWAYASTELVPGEDGEPREGVKGKIKWSFSIELRDGGTYGFLLPPNQIVPASQEVTAAMAYMLNFIAKKDAH